MMLSESMVGKKGVCKLKGLHLCMDFGHQVSLGSSWWAQGDRENEACLESDFSRPVHSIVHPCILAMHVFPLILCCCTR